jgi:hypothetical protein
MNWIELKDLVGGGSIFLFGCHPTQSAYKVKSWLKEKKPEIVVLYAGEFQKIRPYQALHWMATTNRDKYFNYFPEGGKSKHLSSPMESLETAIQAFAFKYNYTPSEIVLVRAKKLRNTSKQVS